MCVCRGKLFSELNVITGTQENLVLFSFNVITGTQEKVQQVGLALWSRLNWWKEKVILICW